MNSSAPAISVIIPALNEEEGIARHLEQFTRLRGCCPTEVIVVDGDARGGTLRALEDSGVASRLQGHVKLNTLCCPPGRAVQMNAGAARASGNILLFLHADAELPPDALSGICAALTTPGIETGAFNLAFRDSGAYLDFIAWGANRRTRLTRIPYGDQAIFLTKELFETVGGYKEIPLMEDLDLMRRLNRRGNRPLLLDQRVQVSGRRYRREGMLYGFLRNNVLASLFYLGVSPERLARFYGYRAK